MAKKMADLSRVDVDDVLIALKSNGRYQIFMYFANTFVYFSEAFPTLSIVFLGKANPHTCAPPPGIYGNDSDYVLDQCSITFTDNDTGIKNVTSCLYGYQYEYPKDMSVVSYFDLVCDRAALNDFSQTLMSLGMAVGSSTFTIASDRYGRKPVIILAQMLVLVSGIGSSLAPNYSLFAVTRFLSGVGSSGMILAAVTYLIEIFPHHQRRYVGSFGLLTWTVCVSSLSPVAYIVRMYSWQIVNLTLTSVSLFSLVQYWINDESIRWLVANNRLEETVRLVKKAAKMNKINANEPLKIIYENIPISNEPDGALNTGDEFPEVTTLLTSENKGRKLKENINENYNFCDLFKHRRIVVTLLIVWFIWFTNSLTYYGLFLTSSSLAGNLYLNFFLNALVEGPSALIYWFTIDRYGRKKTCMAFHAVAAIGMIGSTIFKFYDTPWSSALSTTLSIIGKFGISGSFNVIFMYTPEMIPTNVRNLCYGTASAAARIGGMIAPFSSLLAGSYSWAPGAILGICCIVATILIIFLPETMGKELPQNMLDLEDLFKPKTDVEDR
ncbi:hypothetical protein LOTGIDRAFT_171496 [Lottia gigantea]|uniref:Major facilitator superfamily (MFS) profile domain-containing protein n=1 Tax=Lottia gigantea TaxID=225164 RepID=V4B786_LOTGI|nr:hypothetical protein LOTGIDRAFT_171496 [Lottia gigantea]ESP03406.1 hypothetical protein LOTGIDRAFT_171496 [Lottia gigantea]